MKSPRLNIVISQAELTLLEAFKERSGFRTWTEVLLRPIESHDLLSRIRSAVGSGKLVIEHKDGQRVEIML